jgi:hypothetical protein
VTDALLFIHILAAATWLGANVTQVVVNPVMQRTGGSAASAWMRQTARMGIVLYTPAGAVALITGFWMVFRSSVYQFEQFFVALGIITVIVGGLIGARIFGPLGRKAADLHDSGDDRAAAAVERRLTMWGFIDTALVVVTIYAMVAKLGA